jgi:hypothetical protein
MRSGVAVLAAIMPLLIGGCGAASSTPGASAGPAVPPSPTPAATVSASPDGGTPSASDAPAPELQLGQSFGLVYDPTLERTILVNGAVEGGPARPTELWTWDGAAFELLDGDGPPARVFGAIARDPEREVIVVTGGERASSGAPATTLEWDGSAWTEHPEVGEGPGSRGGTGLAYDTAADALLLFGGAVGFELQPDTWTWDGTTWTQVATSGPPPRFTSLMAAERDGDIILQGGHWVDGNDGDFYADTWRWDGESWTEVTPQVGPGKRVNAPGVWHPGLAGIVMVGGGTGLDSPFADDTWLWRDDTWTEISGDVEPSPRNGHALAYDEARDVIVLVGGVAEPGGPQILDVWEFDGRTWREALPAT